jgi:peroxiredoxin
MSVIAELFDDAKFILNYRRSKMATQKEIDRQAPRAGDLAPDFTLTDSSGAESVTLSDFRGKKPVALVFGSFT